ncbi:hypothetical protein HDU96_006066 [Phlyctochytrium bullatum]|nr:hypothetical protein HDU96_006066 [Phlyctochytrium bullatum]
MSDVDRLRRREDDAAEAIKEARRGVTRAEEAVMRAENRLQKLLDLEIQYFENPSSDVDGQRLEKLSDLLKKDKEELDKARAVLTEARAALKERETALTAAWAELKERETAVVPFMDLTDTASSISRDDIQLDTNRGREALVELVKGNRFNANPALNADGPSVLTELEQSAIRGTNNEPDFTRLMRISFTKVLNESRYPLVHSSKQTRLKPDGFVTLAGLYAPATTAGEGTPYYQLYDSLILFEAKASLGNGHQALGQVLRYLDKLPEGTPAVLYDKTVCWLIYSKGKKVEYIDQIKWTAPGSQEFLLKFIEDGFRRSDWATLLLSAFNAFGVQLVEQRAFLGAGRTGRVFKVLLDKKLPEDDSNVAALKIVRKSHIKPLRHEVAQLLRASATPNLSATVKKHWTVLENGLGAAMAIHPVGEPVDRSTLTKTDISGLFTCLYNLHNAGYIHSDARLPNLINYGGTYRWIDLMHSNILTEDFNPSVDWARKQDILHLSNSILDAPLEAPLPFHYSETGQETSSEDFYTAVADKVWQLLSEQRKNDRQNVL